MKLLIVMLVLGIIIFPIGCYRFLKGRDNARSLQIFGGISFVGLALIIASGGLIINQCFPGIDDQVILVLMSMGFIIGCIVFLRPGFYDKW